MADNSSYGSSWIEAVEDIKRDFATLDSTFLFERTLLRTDMLIRATRVFVREPSLSDDSRHYCEEIVNELLLLRREAVAAAALVFSSVPGPNWPTFMVETEDDLCFRGAGSSPLLVNLEQVAALKDLGHSISDIAKMFGISRSTLYRRCWAAGVDTSRYTDITDEELEAMIRELNHDSPLDGTSMLIGRLREKGIIVQRSRVMDLLRSIDPITSSLRWGQLVHRRRYSVPGPNSLWHMDGHHALIRWGLVVHGCLDGFSRLIVFLACSNNNKADTVNALFGEAVETFGWPSRVRGDKGRENIKVAENMITHHGTERGSFIAGRSTHNQRIERLWRDVFRSVVSVYYNLFYHLEDNQILALNCTEHMHALQFVFQPRINRSLQEFTSGWNNHSLRTEHNKSPLQIWSTGMVGQLQHSSTSYQPQQAITPMPYNAPADDLVPDDINIHVYGIVPGGLESEDTSEDLTADSATQDTDIMSEELMSALQSSNINPLDHVNDYGIELYQRAVAVLQQNVD